MRGWTRESSQLSDACVENSHVHGQMDGERPTFCGTSSTQAKGEGTGSENTSSKRSVREGGQRGGWDRDASLMAPGLCPTSPLARGPLYGFLDSLPHVQIQLPGHLPWGTSSLGRASRSCSRLLELPPLPALAWGYAPTGLWAPRGRVWTGFTLGCPALPSTGPCTWQASLCAF